MSWASASIGELVADLRSGFASGGDDPEGVVQFRMNNVERSGELNWTKLRRVPHSKARKHLLVQAGDILFNATNSPDLVGKTALFNGFDEPITFSNHFLRLRSKRDKVDPAYLSRWLQREFVHGRFAGMCRSWVNQASITKDQLASIEIPLPPLDEQQRIAAILDKADALRRKRKRSLELLDGLTRSTFRQMFQQGTARKPVSAVCDVSSGSTPRRDDAGNFGGTVPWVKTGEVAGDVIRETEENVTEQGMRSARLRLYRPGTVLIAMYGQGATRGRVGLLGVESTINQACAALVPRNGLNSTFLFHQLRGSYEDLRALGRGGNQPNLNGDLVKKFEIMVPPIEQQLRFSSIVDRIELRAQAMRSSLSKLEATFSSLQHRAFDGQL